jgi:hypothetical protein
MDTILVSLNSKMKLTKSTPMGYFFLFVSLPFFFLPYIRASFSGCYIRRLVGGRAAQQQQPPPQLSEYVQRKLW